MEKNLSLLRPFDLEKAKAGEAVAWSMDGEIGTFIAGPDHHNQIVIDWPKSAGLQVYTQEESSRLRMAPLGWVEGKPVYKGDTLYHNSINDGKTPLTVTGPHPNITSSWDNGGGCVFSQEGSMDSYGLFCFMTWQKPKVKKTGWVNVYPSTFNVSGRACGGIIYTSKEQAIDTNFSDDIITTIQIEWEEQQ